MLNERRRAVQIVTADFLKAEKAADEAATLAAACMRSMLEQRAAAGLPVGTGLEAISLVNDATAELVRARHRLIEAHAALAQVREGIGIRGYGDISECPDAFVAPSGSAVHLAAVA